jgi:hypothetical protein
MHSLLAILTTLSVFACGDNIKPSARPDARIYYPPMDPLVDPGTAPEPDGVNPGDPKPPDPHPPLADAGLDAAQDACVDIYGHEWNGEGTGHETNHCP